MRFTHCGSLILVHSLKITHCGSLIAVHSLLLLLCFIRWVHRRFITPEETVEQIKADAVNAFKEEYQVILVVNTVLVSSVIVVS